MKKMITSCIASLLAVMTVNAQNWVNTSPQNKKVVLEEFTGIKCTFCPDGHKRANELKAANKGNVFLVNIHSGGYATPAAGEPDFRTTEGDAIDDASGLTGYPAGSINRFKSPRAEGRGNWSASANTVLAQSSPVNTYVKSFFDRKTRELTTEVEVYYTADGSANNKLTVMLTQDNILGPQTGGTTYYPENFVGDQYKHNHVLRDVLTPGGAWGETISETSKGSYIYKKYVTVLPEKIKNVPLTFFNLNVVAFVSESDNNNILTGAEASVEYDPTGAVDLSLTNKTVAPSGLCVDAFKPSVEVTNTSSETVTSFDMTINTNGVEKTESFSGSLAPGAKTTIEFNQTITPQGEYNVSVSGFKNINGGDFFDTDLSNDATTISGLGFQKNAFTYNKIGLNGTMDMHAGRLIKANDDYRLVGDRGKAGGSMLYYLHSSWGNSGKPGQLILGEADFTSMTDPIVSFYYAYSDGGLGGTAPVFDIEVSDNCGVGFDYVKMIECEETGQPADPQYLYAPTSNEFRQVTIDLSAYAGKKVLISIAGVPGSSGNALYLDEIEVGSASKIANVQTIDINGLKVYPNPANDVLNITLENKDEAKAVLLDMQGKVITDFNIVNGNGTLNTGAISEGIYLLNISCNEDISTVKVDIKH